jgi:hypothetical protein
MLVRENTIIHRSFIELRCMLPVETLTRVHSKPYSATKFPIHT